MHSNFITNILNVEINEISLVNNLNDDIKKELSNKYRFKNDGNNIHVNFEEEYGINKEQAMGVFHLTLNLLDYKFSRFLKISYTFYFKLNRSFFDMNLPVEDYAQATRLPMSLHIRNHIQLLTSLEASKDPILLPFNLWNTQGE